MSKFWTQSVVLTAAIVKLSFPSFSILIESSTIAQNLESSTEIRSEFQHPILDLWSRKPPEESEPVNGDSLCQIWPSQPHLISNTRVIWNVRPVFIMREELKSITVFWNRSDGKRVVVLSLDRVESQPINSENEDSPKVFQYPVDVEPLKPGREYAVSVTYLAKINTREGAREVETQLDIPISFDVVDNPEYQQIETDLNNLQLQNPSLNREELALKRAEYFIKKGMWADFLQECFSVSNPSANWVKAVDQISSEICKDV